MRPFGHGDLPLSIRFHLPRSLFCPLHLVHQGLDLELHHILRRLWEEKRHGIGDGLIDHHHGQSQVAEKPGVNAVRGEAKDGEQLSVKDDLIPPKGLKIFFREAAAHLLLLFNGQNGNPAFGSIATVFQESLHPRPPAEAGGLHQGPGILQQPGLLVPQGVKHQLLLGGKEAVEKGLGDARFPAESADARNGLARDLGEFLGCEVEEIQASDYNAIIEALRTGSADMAYMGSQALALGVERTGLEPIVMKAEDGDPEKAVYHSVFITNASNEDINSIQDVKGRTMAFVDPDSTSGNLIPTAEIIQAFPDDGLNSDMLHTNGDFFEAVSFSGSHQAGLQAIVKGDVDVAPISDQILASEIANGNAAESDVKIIHESAAIPAEAMVVAEHVSQETRDKLAEFLTGYENEEYFTDVIKVPGARFIECDMSDYQEIIELNKIINEF